MPIKHAALKQIHKDQKRQHRNQAVRGELRTLTRRFHGLLAENKPTEAAQLLRELAKEYDTAASKRVIHRNTAARFKSRLTRRLNKLHKT